MDGRIVLGSGKLYYATYSGTIPTDGTIEQDSNLLGLIQGGATIRYTPSYYTAKDDFGLVIKTIITDEEAVLTSGIMTFDANTLNKLISTGTVTETAGERKILIGGYGNFSDTKYVLHFVHEDEIDGDIRVTIVGSNQGALELAFRKNQETIINAEFTAAPSDDGGTLIIYREEIIDWVAVTGVTLSDETLALTAGGASGALTATVAPANATNDSISWASSNEAIATVSNGVVVPVAAGSATITVTTEDGLFTDTCAVTVTE